MKKYFLIQKLLLSLNLSTLLAYRANFFNSLISSMIWGIMSILMMTFLSNGSKTVYGWKQQELLLMIGVYNILISFFHMFFSRNFQRLSEIIHTGQIDSLLVKPIDSQYIVSFWIANFTSLFRLLLGTIYSFFILSQMHIVVTFWNILLFIFLLLFSITFLYAFWFGILTLTIWYTRLSNLVELLYEINGVSRFPAEMFKELGSFVFFFFLPLTLIVNTPTKILLGKNELMEITFIIFATVSLFLFTRWFWKFALRYYSSASS